MPEANLGTSHDDLASMLKRFKRVYIYHREDGGIGLMTTRTSKLLYVERTMDYLYDDGVSFDPDFISGNPHLNSSINKEKHTREEFRKQLLGFKKYLNPPLRVGGTPTVSYSGKADDEGKIIRGKEDDMVLVYTMNSHIQREISRGHTSVPVNRLLAASAA